MAKVKLKRKTKYTLIKYKLGKEEQLNTMELDIVSKGEIPYLLPAAYSQGAGGKVISIRVENCMEFKDYLRRGISFGEFLSCVRQVLCAVSECECHGIRTSNLSLRMDGCFFDDLKKEIRLCFWPVLALDEYSDIESFLYDMGQAYIAKNSDIASRLEYMNLFSVREKFDSVRFEEKINQLEARSSDSYLPNPDSKKSGPYLIREKNKSKIVISGLPFTIGKKSEFCDYVIPENRYISRRHLTILSRSGAYFAKDENAKNKSRIDGAELGEGREARLHEGSVLRLGDENFIFHLNSNR